MINVKNIRFFQAAGLKETPGRHDTNQTTKEEYERAIPIVASATAAPHGDSDYLSASKRRIILGDILMASKKRQLSFLQLFGFQLTIGFLLGVSPPRLLRLHP